jgi:hypothetical protein
MEKKNILCGILLSLLILVSTYSIQTANCTLAPSDHKRFESFDSFDNAYWAIYGNGSYQVSDGILSMHINQGSGASTYSKYLFTEYSYSSAKISVCFKLSKFTETCGDGYQTGIHFSMGFGNYSAGAMYPPSNIDESNETWHGYNEATFEFNTNSKHDSDGDKNWDSGDGECIAYCCDRPDLHTMRNIWLEDFFIDDSSWHTLTMWWESGVKLGYFLDNICMASFTSNVPYQPMTWHFGAFNYQTQSQPLDLYLDWIEIQCSNYLDNAHVSWGDWFSNDASLNTNYWTKSYVYTDGVYFDAYDKLRFKYLKTQGEAIAQVKKNEKLHIGETILHLATWGVFNAEFDIYFDMGDEKITVLFPNNDGTHIQTCSLAQGWQTHTVSNYYDGQYRNLRYVWAYQNNFWKVSIYWNGALLRTFTITKGTNHTYHNTYELRMALGHYGTHPNYDSTFYVEYVEYWVLNSYYGMY